MFLFHISDAFIFRLHLSCLTPFLMQTISLKEVHKHSGPCGAPLPLIFALIGMQCVFLHSGKHQLPNPMPLLQLYGAPVGIEQLQSDLPLKAGIHPACVLDEQPKPPQ